MQKNSVQFIVQYIMYKEQLTDVRYILMQNQYRKDKRALVAGINLLNDLIEKCIAENLLTEPQQKIGPEGVLLVVEK